MTFSFVRCRCARHAEDLVKQINVALTIEHLGALQWDEITPGVMGPTGRHELGMFFVPDSPEFVDAAFSALQTAQGGPTLVAGPLQGPDGDEMLPGEGYLLAIAGINTANYITGPT